MPVTLGRFLAAAALCLVPGSAVSLRGAPGGAPSVPTALPGPSATPPVERRVLPDGSVEIRDPDGTVRRQIPDESISAALPEPMTDMDPATRAKYQEALRGYFSYRLQGYEQRQKTFAWQLFSSRIIFWAVLTLVFAGIYFAAVQFHVGLRGAAGPPGAEARTEFAASLEGVKVSSPVLGVIILVISLVFFYLYLAFVYPISEIF